MFKISLQEFRRRYGAAMANARREGAYGFPMSIPKALKNDPMGRRAIETSFKAGRAESRGGRKR